MKKAFRKLFRLFHPEYKTVIVEDIPIVLKPYNVYLVGSKKYFWQVAFMCPCGCKEIIHLNILPNAYPKWGYKLNKKKQITLSPSIARKKGCKSHFFIRNGKVVWADY